MGKAILIFLLGSSLKAEDRFLDWMNQIAQQQLDKREAAVKAVQSVDQAEARKRWVRAKILELIGGLPDYNGPLNARVTGRLERACWPGKASRASASGTPNVRWIIC